jgi:cell division protein FtsB
MGLGGAVLLFAYLSGPEGGVRLVQLLFERRHLVKELDDLSQENISLQQTIKRFQHDSGAVEEEAREKLGLVKKGEVIYRFPKRK